MFTKISNKRSESHTGIQTPALHAHTIHTNRANPSLYGAKTEYDLGTPSASGTPALLTVHRLISHAADIHHQVSYDYH